MRRIRRRQPLHMMNDLSLTPLVDTALTLLIIFMVAAPMMKHAVRVTLPKGSLQEAKDTKEELVVYVDKDNAIFFNAKKVTVKELCVHLLKSIGSRQDVSLFIRADKNSSWGVVLELFESLRSIKGIAHVVLPTQKIV